MNKLSIQKIALSENAKAKYKKMYLAAFKKANNDLSELEKVFILYESLVFVNRGVAVDFLKDIQALVKSEKATAMIKRMILAVQKQKLFKNLKEYYIESVVMLETVSEEFFNLGYGSYDDIDKAMLEALDFE